MDEIPTNNQTNQMNTNDSPTSPGVGGSYNEDPEKTGARVAVIVAVVILVLFGLYWGGKMLLAPGDEPDKRVPREGGEVTIESECDDKTVYTSINSALGNAKSVCKLDLSGQGLTSISPYIGHFTSLVEFDVSDNNLSVLPPEIGWLRKLQRFDTSNNKLTVIAPETGWLREVREWNLSNNQITTLPLEMGWLKKMEVLNLANNQITNIPLEFGWMAGMKTFDLSGNPAEVGTSANKVKMYMRGANIILP